MNVRRLKDRRNGSIFIDIESVVHGYSTDKKLKGRMERRLPIIVLVRLAHGVAADSDGEERTYTDNISPCGACVFSKRPWQPGDLIRITPISEECVLGKVVYCQRLQDDRYSFGAKFEGGPVTWSIIQRYGLP